MMVVEGVAKDFGGVRALDAISFSVAKGSIFGIIGPNGSGKSTLFDIIAGATNAQAGSVMLEGARIDGRAPHDIAARGIARTRQATRLFSRMTALENVVAGAHLRAEDRFWDHLLMLPSTRRARASIVGAAREALALVGLAGRSDVEASGLREGERRRVGLARAIVSAPKLLLLDELGAGLDDSETAFIRTVITVLARERGTTIIVAERDLTPCFGLCDQALVLHAGQRIAEGTPDALRHDQDVLDAYLGVEWRQ